MDGGARRRRGIYGRSEVSDLYAHSLFFSGKLRSRYFGIKEEEEAVIAGARLMPNNEKKEAYATLAALSLKKITFSIPPFH